MPRKPNVQLLQRLKEILQDPSIPPYEKTNSALARRLGISKRYVIILKKKLSGELKNKFTGELINSSPQFPLELKNQDKIVKSTKSDDKEARSGEFSDKFDRSKVPVETRLENHTFDVGVLFGGFSSPVLHNLWLDCGVVSGCFKRAVGLGYFGRVKGNNIVYCEKIVRFGDCRFCRFEVYRNGRVLVGVECSSNPLDDRGFYSLFNVLSVELYRLNGNRFFDFDRVVVDRFEVNCDGNKVSMILDKVGVKSVTFKSFGDAFLRAYRSKDRVEIGGRAGDVVKFASVFQLFQGGVSVFNVLQQLAFQVMRLNEQLELLKRENEVLRVKVDEVSGGLKKVTITPKLDSLVKSSNFSAEIEGLGRKSVFSSQLSAQDHGKCPFYVDGCREPGSRYSAYVNSDVREKYCFGDYRSCFNFKFFVKRYGLKFKGGR